MAHTLTAAQAADDYANGTLPPNTIVEDTAANIIAFLDTLEQIALSGNLRAIEITGSTVLNLDVAQVQNDPDALLKLRPTYELAISDTAANVAAGLSEIEWFVLHNRVQSITLTGSGHPVLNVTGTQVRHDLGALLKVSGTSNVVVTDVHSMIAANLDSLQRLVNFGKLASINITDTGALVVSAAQVRMDAKALAAISGPYLLAVKDSSADIVTYLPYLEGAAKAGHLQRIFLTDSNPISLTWKQFSSDGDALAKISGAYSLTVTGVSAANATTVAANSHVTGIFISDSALHIQHYLSQLETLTGGTHAERGVALASGGVYPSGSVLDGIALTDSGTPTLSLSESALSGATGVLGLITTPYVLSVTGVLAADAAALSSNPLIDVLSVSDSASSIAAHFAGLEAAMDAGKLGTVTVASGTFTSADVSDEAFALYAHFAGARGITLALGNLSANEPGGLFGQFLTQGPASLGITAPVGIAVQSNQLFMPAFLLDLQHAADSGYLASFTMAPNILVEDMTTSQFIQLDNTTIIQALLSTGDFHSYSEGTISAAEAVSYFASALSTAVENSTAHVNDTAAVSDAAMIGGILDSAANIAANLDTLATALAGRALTLPIQLTDDLPPTIAVSVTQALNDAAVLNAITSSFLLSIDGSASALNSIDLSALTNEKIELGFTNLNQDVTVEGGNILDVNLAHLLVANDVISVEAYSSGGQTGTEIDLTGTDGMAHKIIILGVNPSDLTIYTPFDTGTALGGHGTQVTGGISVAAALGGSGSVAITDTVTNVQANLDALEAIHGRITGIGFSDSGTPTLTLSEAQLVSDNDILQLLSGNYHIALTGVAALDAANLAGSTDVSTIAITDSAADVLANLDALEHVAKAGKLAAVTLTDSGTPAMLLSESQLFADQDALAAITTPYVLSVTGVLAADAAALSSNPLIDVLSVSDSASSIAAHFAGLEAAMDAGKLGTVTVASGTFTSADVSDEAFALYAHFAGARGITLALGNLSANEPGGLFGQFLTQGPASLGITAPVGIAVQSNQLFMPAFLLDLQHAADSGYLASFTMAPNILVEDMTTSQFIQLDNTTIIQALLSTGDFHSYSEGTISAAEAVSYFASALSTAVENSTAHVNDTAAVSDAAMIGGILDSAANIAANLDTLATALAGRALTLPIQLTDDLPPTIAVSVTQALNDAAVLNAITSSFLLSIDGSASALNSIDLSALTNEKIELGFTNLNQDVTVEGGNILDVNLAHLLVANDVISVEAYSSGGQTGTEIDLTGTDGMAHKIIILGVNPSDLTIYTPFDTGTALGGHGTQVTGGISVAAALGGSGSVAITDTVTNVQANLDALEAIHGRITGIGFSDSGTPTLTLSEAQLVSDNDILQLLSGNYHIALTGVAALDAANLAGSTDVSTIAITDSAADVLANLDALEHVAKAGKLAAVTLTDSGTPAMLLSESQLFADQDALAAITTPYVLSVTGVLAADAAALSSNPLIDVLSVSDSASSIAAHFAGLEAAMDAGKLGTVTVASGTFTSADVSDEAFALYAHFAGARGITLALGNLSANEPGGLFGQFLTQGPASLGITAPVGIAVQSNQLFMPAFLLDLQHAADSGYLASFTMAANILVEDMTTSQFIQLDNTTIIQALLSTGDFHSYSEGTISAAEAVSYFASALSTAVENSTAHVNDTAAVSDAAMIGGILDSAAHIEANLDTLTTALAGRALTLPIQLTDDLPPTIAVSVTQALNDAQVLGSISSTYLLSIAGTAEQLDGLTLSPVSNEKVELAVTSLDHDITINTAVFDVDLAKLAVANDTVTVEAYSSGGQTGTEIDLTGTDGMAHKIIILGVDPDSFEVYAPVDSGLAAGGHGTQVTDGLTVAQALAGSGPEAISDTAANVAANLDALASIAGQITGIGFTDAGTPAFSLTEAQFSADHDVLALLSGNYALNVTNVAAVDALDLAAYTDVSGISVTDTGADIATELDQLEHIFKLGKLEGVSITSGDLGTLTENQLLVDGDVLKLIGNFDGFLHH